MAKSFLPSFIISILILFSLLIQTDSNISIGLPPLPVIPEILKFVDERLAIVYPIIQTFKLTITSDPLGITASWVGPDICNYRGFFCDSPPDNRSATAIASIDFNGFHLSAPTLAGFIDQLPDIALFHANSNNFAGSIPATIKNLPYLYEIDLSNNRLSGPFPTVVLGLPQLSFLDLRYNFFQGAVPPQIFAQNLDVLFLNNNGFDHMIPNTLGSTHVLYLTLANNKFTGPIPRSISSASLTELVFVNNRFSGCLPYEIGLLNGATVVDLGNNKLTGHLPYSLVCLEGVEQVNFAGNGYQLALTVANGTKQFEHEFHGNLLYGAVPEVVCWLGIGGNLVNMSLSNNYFTQVGPLCRQLIEVGSVDVRNNCIPGLPGQRPVSECGQFFSVPRLCPRMWTYSYVPCKHGRVPSSVLGAPGSAPSP